MKSESVTAYSVPSPVIVSVLCFVFSSSYKLSSFTSTAVGNKIHCSEPPSVNIHYDNL